jgi:hypothetical protein
MNNIGNMAYRFESLAHNTNILKKVHPQIGCDVVHTEKQWAQEIFRREIREGKHLEARGFDMGSKFWPRVAEYKQAVREWDEGGRERVYKDLRLRWW